MRWRTGLASPAGHLAGFSAEGQFAKRRLPHDFSARSEFQKRALDLVIAGIAIVLLSPVLVLLTMAIRITSPGPALFRQVRYGRHNVPFRILKFRTMYVDQEDLTGTHQTCENDPRVTPLGRFLRRTNLDELPQLLNVLRGEMSLVGPRAHVPEMLAGGKLYEELVPNYFLRHKIKPGMTGLAQILGYRGSTRDPEAAIARIASDLDYIENWSIGFDLRILWVTVQREFFGGTGI